MWVGKGKKRRKIKRHGAPHVILEIVEKSRTGVELRDSFKFSKKLIGVNDIVIENVELEATSVGEQIVIRARPRKNAQCRCGICGR